MNQLLQSISIIGGADGPTSIFVSPKGFGFAAACIVLLIAALLALFALVILKLRKSIKSRNTFRAIIFASLIFVFAIAACAFLIRKPSKPENTVISIENTRAEPLSNKTETYAKGDFPSDFKWNGTNAEPVLDTETKKNYRTIITEASWMPPDFNGKYKIAQYGAGTMANGFFIINLETGAVTEGFAFEFALDYSIDSKLIIRNPKEAILDFWKDELKDGEEIPDWCITEYYIFEDGKLTLLKKLEPGELKK